MQAIKLATANTQSIEKHWIRLSLHAVLALVYLSIVFAPAMLASPQKPGWKVIQNNGEFGQIRILFDDKAGRIHIPSRQITIISKAPKWEVVVYNSRDKLMYRTSLDNWCKSGVCYLADINREYFAKGYEKRLISYFNRRAIYATAATPGTPGPPMLFRTQALNQEEKKFSHVSTVVSQDISIDKNVSRFLRGLYRFPPIHGVPLAIYYSVPSGSRVCSHATLSLESTNKMDEKQLLVPSGYRQVATADMAIGGTMVESFFEEMLPK